MYLPKLRKHYPIVGARPSFAGACPSFIMSQQPLAFTLVKTVITARDEGRELAPAYQTAWDLLREEMSVDMRQLSEAVHWGPEYQSDLRSVIDSVRVCLTVDPALETEISTFVAEHEVIAQQAPLPETSPIAPIQEPSAQDAASVESGDDGVTSTTSLYDSAAAEGVSFTYIDEVSPESEAVLTLGDDTKDLGFYAEELVSSRSDDFFIPAPNVQISEDPSLKASLDPPSSQIPMIVLEPDLLAEIESEELAAGRLTAISRLGDEDFKSSLDFIEEREWLVHDAYASFDLHSSPDLQATSEVDEVAELHAAAAEVHEAYNSSDLHESLDPYAAAEPPYRLETPIVPPLPVPAMPIVTPTLAWEAPQAAKRDRWPLIVGLAVAALAILGLVLFFALRGSDETTDGESAEASKLDSAETAVPEITGISLPIAPEALVFSESGQWPKAQEAQLAYVNELRASEASPLVQADAFAKLGEYADAAEDFTAAIKAQKSSLDLAKSAHGESSPAAADAHLMLAGYYIHNNEEHMAKAHFLQGRVLLEAIPEASTPERAAKLQQLGDQLGDLGSGD